MAEKILWAFLGTLFVIGGISFAIYKAKELWKDMKTDSKALNILGGIICWGFLSVFILTILWLWIQDISERFYNIK